MTEIDGWLVVAPARIDAASWGVRLPPGASGATGRKCRVVTRAG